MSHEAPPMPVAVGVMFAHAAVQAIAEHAAIDVLHIKGPAIHPAIRGRDETGAPFSRHSSDADVWVRPSRVADLFAAMQHNGWRLLASFENGSSFEHAATLMHPALAPVDVHRTFPGITADPEVAFERLWSARETALIAGTRCWVPAISAQRLILILNGARKQVEGNTDIAAVWLAATQQERDEVDHLGESLSAQVALAAGTGRLHFFRGARGYSLWHLLSTGTGTPTELWLARVRAEPTWPRALRRGFKLVFPNPRRMALQVGHPMSSRELARAYGRQVGKAVRHTCRTLLLRLRPERT